ncbi:MAG: hypothetical protein WCJ69_15265 [Betaproteobacteria bacterium]
MKGIVWLDADVGGTGILLDHASEGIADVGADIDDRLRGVDAPGQVRQEPVVLRMPFLVFR